MEKRLHKHPDNITTKIMETHTTGGWQETTTRMREHINETLHNTKNEYINPQQLKRYFRHNIQKTSGGQTKISTRKYKLREDRGTTKTSGENTNAANAQKHVLQTCTGIHDDDTTKIKINDIFDSNPTNLKATAKQLTKIL